MPDDEIAQTSQGWWYVYIIAEHAWLSSVNSGKLIRNTSRSSTSYWGGYFLTEADAERALKRYYNKSPIHLGGE